MAVRAMNVWLFGAGILLVAFTIIDALWTILWVDGGGGPLSARTTHWTWKAIKAIFPSDKHKLLSLAGPLTLTLILLSWVVLLWVGWTLVFGPMLTPLSILTKIPL